jgi:hypothetical protein
MRQAQSEIPAYRQAGAFEMANFFRDDIKYYDVQHYYFGNV